MDHRTPKSAYRLARIVIIVIMIVLSIILTKIIIINASRSRFRSLADDMGAESAGGRAVRHGRDDRLPDGGVPQVDKLLVVPGREDDAVPEQEVRDVGHGEQLPHPHATHHPGPEPGGLRQLQVHIQELARRDRGLHQTLRYV